MSCTCYSGYFNPGCPDHGSIYCSPDPRPDRAKAPTPHPQPAQQANIQIVSISKSDTDSMSAYDTLMGRLKTVHREMRNDGQHPSAVVLIAIDGENRILCPMILAEDGIKDVLPSVFDTIAEGLRKRTVQ